MKFEDPKKYLQRPDEFTDYVMGLYFEYRDVVYDMYNRLAPLFPEIPLQTIYVETIGGIDENLGRSINGMNVPLNKIHIYLYSIAIAAFDDCIDLHRNDIDTIFKANLAFTLMHEMSHAAQFTYVPESMRNAMEYANDHHVYEYMIPIAASMLKKQYKINVLKDRVDSSVTKVYSYPYQSMNTQWEQLVNYIVYNSIPKSSFTLTPEEKFRCDAFSNRILKDIVNLRVIYSIHTIHTNVSFDDYLKKDGVVCTNAVLMLTNMIHEYMPISFNIELEFDIGNLNDASIKINIKDSTDYYPIDAHAYQDLLTY